MSYVKLDPEKARDLVIFLGRRSEAGLTLCELLADPEKYSTIWKEIYFLLTGSRLETKSEKKYGEMLDRYMNGKI